MIWLKLQGEVTLTPVHINNMFVSQSVIHHMILNDSDKIYINAIFVLTLTLTLKAAACPPGKEFRGLHCSINQIFGA